MEKELETRLDELKKMVDTLRDYCLITLISVDRIAISPLQEVSRKCNSPEEARDLMRLWLELTSEAKDAAKECRDIQPNSDTVYRQDVLNAIQAEYDAMDSAEWVKDPRSVYVQSGIIRCSHAVRKMKSSKERDAEYGCGDERMTRSGMKPSQTN